MKIISYIIVLSAFFATQNTYAVPVTYDFSADYSVEARGFQTFPFRGIEATTDQLLFPGMPDISGSFEYDADFTGSVGTNATRTDYIGAITNMNFSIGGFNISDSEGVFRIFNDTLNGTEDAMIIMANRASGSNPDRFPINNMGLTLTDGNSTTFALTNIRLFWLEGVTDFVSDSLLPDTLPPPGADGVMRLALDFFQLSADGSLNLNNQHIAFFEPLLVASTPVPEPTTLMLLIIGLLGLNISRRMGA